jgi:hypothetical protein
MTTFVRESRIALTTHERVDDDGDDHEGTDGTAEGL